MDDNNKEYNQSDVKFKSMSISQMENETTKIEGEITINDHLRKNLFYLFCILYCVSNY